MKKTFLIIAALLFAVILTLPANAEGGTVTYSGNSGEFIFAPGSDDSPTDLFGSFKDVMPGDSVTQSITVKNNADNKVKVKIYLRSLGAVNGDDSKELLSALHLRVDFADNNSTEYMFDAAASETAQLTDWVCLGILYSGGEVDLDLILDVPKELGNEYSGRIGYLDWEFKVEEYPVEPDDPGTGDRFRIELYLIPAVAALILIFIIVRRRKRSEGESSQVL